MKYQKKHIVVVVLLLMGLYSCGKGEHVTSFAQFVDVYFDADQTALRSNGAGVFIAAKYNGNPIEWDILSKKIRVVAGEGRFEFYDTRSGQVVAEKVIDVKAGSKETYTMFQPTLDAPVVFVDPIAQEAESPAPAGHIKVKVANYANDLIPFENLDIKVSLSYFDADFNTVVKEVGTIKGVKRTVDQAVYQILPNALPSPLPEFGYHYVFEFVNSETGEPLLNLGGTAYANMAFSPADINPLPVKNIFTLYMISQKAWGEAPPFIKKDDSFYEIVTKVLFAN